MDQNNDDRNNSDNSPKKGFAAMSKDKQREIASKGGRAAHEAGTAYEWDSEEARKAGQKSRGGGNL